MILLSDMSKFDYNTVDASCTKNESFILLSAINRLKYLREIEKVLAIF